ncbi:MAG: DUF362 domain-containing protein [Planctomycetaceae bacterium]|nr:DUF362 domain-containing protein [Planctomycetaceae bacterium]
MKRKDFLKAITLAGTAAGAGIWDGVNVFAQTNEAKNDDCELAVVMGGEPDVMFQKAIAAFGGMGKFVKSGQKVVIKPNIGWDRSPETAANTNPILVGEMVKQCRAAGAGEVLVFDRTVNAWQSSYKTSGIEDAVKDAGGVLVPSGDEADYREVDLPQGVTLKKTKIHKALLDCDVWFNVPVLKTHGGTKLTIALKNYMGIVWDRGIFHSSGLDQCIADCATYVKKPVLNVIDAYRAMKANGPRGVSEADAVLLKGLVVSPDIVAADTAAMTLFNQIPDADKMDLDIVRHIKLAEELGLGKTDLAALNVERIRG